MYLIAKQTVFANWTEHQTDLWAPPLHHGLSLCSGQQLTQTLTTDQSDGLCSHKRDTCVKPLSLRLILMNFFILTSASLPPLDFSGFSLDCFGPCQSMYFCLLILGVEASACNMLSHALARSYSPSLFLLLLETYLHYHSVSEITLSWNGSVPEQNSRIKHLATCCTFLKEEFHRLTSDSSSWNFLRAVIYSYDM